MCSWVRVRNVEAGAGAAEDKAYHYHHHQHSGYLEGGRLDDRLGPQVRGEERVRALQSVVGCLGGKIVSNSLNERKPPLVDSFGGKKMKAACLDEVAEGLGVTSGLGEHVLRGGQ